MRRTITIVGLAFLAAFELGSSAVAVHTACTETATSSASTALTELDVSSTASYLDAAACGGDRFYSEAEDCPVPAVEPVSVRGAYCGFVVPSSGSALCKWVAVSNTPTTRLFVGFDWDGSGNLSSASETVWGPMVAGQFYEVVNSGVSARLIAFPTNMDDDTVYAFDQSVVSCGPL